ncbi:MAG: ribonuclease D [Roseitalea sp.]|jgi:ribonuclease D|uniref:Ribonuclease D n=1 Tax=Oceaniradius stylonematis TaxID=2184161 RepID=A0A3A8AA74_9HYPH|nr:ribonuclease D [Oceaniradius stylonematis]MBO6552956.1 ribonuclease D [Roseitalea sp.]MBO6951284.1 ribonuclease D [Rhizobiaceae bacterium]MBO6590729.1 ribonuclease D [Roseitalea sp.]MBO6600013.1 ribonuclease D [Roseitalea sp.]MBO6611769.1 ribonuclease D [Roseitalea sp.]
MRDTHESAPEPIGTTAALEAVCARMAAHDYITIDTEFVRETTFWPVLCLIQVASDDEAVLIDPMADDIDLAPLFALLGDESVIKVFHAARQDIEIFVNLSGHVPHPIFDTQVAAMVLGFGDAIAYDQLVKRVSGAHIDKTSRFTDWALRPLSDKQLHYALADVTHLRDVYKRLTEMLEERGRAHWVAEEMAVLTSPDTYDIKPEDAWRRLKMRVRKPADLAVMQRLAAWRERQARERNVPRNRVLKDDAIYEAAQQQPRDARALSRLRTIHKGIERSAAGAAILDAVAEVAALDREDLPKVPRPPNSPEGAGAAADLLKVLLKLTAEQHNVAQRVIATSDHLDQIASHGENADVPAMHGWRRELFGSEALRLLSGEISLGFSDRRITTVDLTADRQSPDPH